MISQAGHSVPEVGYDRFADRRFEGFGLIIDFDPHAATKVQNFVILWRVFDARTARHASRNEAGAAECNRQGSAALSRSGKVVRRG
jgi:hypothetical protein